MAGFKCDICGGDIKMQANKTGVCQTCGMQYDLEAIRAMLGQQSAPVQSAPQPAEAAPAVSAPQPAAPVAAAQPDEIDRESLLVYLNDVRTMETIVANSKNTITIFSNKKREMKQKFEDDKKALQLELPEKPEKEKSEAFYAYWTTESWIMGAIILVCLFLMIKSKSAGSNGLFVLFLIITILLAIGICAIIHKNKVRKAEYNYTQERIEKEYKEKLKKYEEELEAYKEQSSKNEKLRKSGTEEYIEREKSIDNAANDVKNELTNINGMLKKAYDANIIPQQFRNIEGVYYLYDYLSTSNQSLSEALMQANLEAIKQKMDNMIKLQSAQIVQQAQTNAKLDNIQQQNERLVQLSEATMNNTAVAAKYAQIAAVNSELNVKLAAESLAYQKAAFWLK